MKKWWICFLIFLMGCLDAPQRAFQLNQETPVYSLDVQKTEVVSLAHSFDTNTHIENEIPTTPEEAIIQWNENHLKATQKGDKKLVIVIHKINMITEEKINSWFKHDEEIYTLNYSLEIQLRQEKKVIQNSTVSGKGFITLAKKSSLSAKEEGWAWLIQKMLDHLQTKLQTDFKNVIIS